MQLLRGFRLGSFYGFDGLGRCGCRSQVQIQPLERRQRHGGVRSLLFGFGFGYSFCACFCLQLGQRVGMCLGHGLCAGQRGLVARDNGQGFLLAVAHGRLEGGEVQLLHRVGGQRGGCLGGLRLR